MPKRLWIAGLSSLLGTGCSSGEALAPPLPSCTAANAAQVSLGAVARDTALDLTQAAGCALFPTNLSTTAAIRYLVVPQSASATPNESQAYQLRGSPLLAAVAAAAFAVPAPATPAQQFDLSLRRAERELAARVPAPARAPARALLAPTPVDSGNVRTFKVCAVAVGCDARKSNTLASVTATALKVGQHIAIYVDNAAPQPGMSQSDLDNLRAIFDTSLYELDTLAFGRESDIDNNGMVIVLMTGKVNALVSKDSCAKGLIAGYFFGADLITTPPFATGNNGEIFYAMVPDPSATLSCAYSVLTVRQLVPQTFVHEFQHMISFNQHFLLRGESSEDLWLNEGLSHYAEELGGRSFLPADSATFCSYVFGDVFNAGQYFGAPQNYFLVDTAGIGGLAERGAYWLFVRYLVDRFSTDASTAAANVVTRSLEQTARIGADNVSAATATPFDTLLKQWAFANYVSDLPGFAVPPKLRYTKWQFRTAFPVLNARCSNRIPAAFPLDTAAHAYPASSISASGVLRAGSAGYYIAQQAPGEPEFILQVNGFDRLVFAPYSTLLGASVVPRLNVIRLQ